MPPKAHFSAEDTLGAALRALAGCKVECQFGGNELHGFIHPSGHASLPSLPADDNDEERRLVRGEADLHALFHRYHQPDLHAASRPRGGAAAATFDALERTRIELLGARYMQGVAHNLQERDAQYCDQQGYARLGPNDAPPMGDLLASLLKQRMLGSAPPKSLAPMLKHWQPFIEEQSGDTLAALMQQLEDQSAYAELVKQLLQQLEAKAEEQVPQESDTEESDEEDGSDSLIDEAQEENQPQLQQAPGSQRQKHEMPSQKLQLPMPHFGEEEDGSGEEEEQHYTHNHPEFEEAPTTPYTVYTQEYDEVIGAEKLAESEELTRLRHQLDQKLTAYHAVTSRLAAKLQRILLAQQTREWTYNMEEGYLDTARLARVIIRADTRTIYKQESQTEFRDTLVTLLLDNSGSMRGRPITIAALSADILARTLERCGVKVEVLGFTTRDWKGGQSRKHWMHHGRQEQPGRLNDLRHIIYKSADTRLARARKNFALMLKEGLLKENIDGEALLWAHQRMMARPEQRRILMVISDGAPVDDSTLSANDGGYLDAHLREVIHGIEKQSDVELLAIGIGHDVTRYYRHAVMLNDVHKLGDTMLEELVRLFDPQQRALAS